MSRFGGDIGRFIKHCRRLVSEDWDNVMLFTGPEGSGKTTFAFQVLRALDPKGFPGHGGLRVQFTHEAFLRVAAEAPKRAAVLWDEGRLNKRRAMHSSTLDVLDYLQDCRALNHHLGICFPHEALLDSAVKDHRVRYRFHVPQRGLAVLYVRAEKRNRRGESDFFWYATGDRFRFLPNRGSLWEEYSVRKDAHMRRKNVAGGALGEVVDEASFDAVFGGLKDEFAGPGEIVFADPES